MYHDNIFNIKVYVALPNRFILIDYFIRIQDYKKGKRKVQEVPQPQAAVLPRHQKEEETDKTKQSQVEQTYEKH